MCMYVCMYVCVCVCVYVYFAPVRKLSSAFSDENYLRITGAIHVTVGTQAVATTQYYA